MRRRQEKEGMELEEPTLGSLSWACEQTGGLSGRHLLRMAAEKTFPQPVRITDGGERNKGRLAFVRAEVRAWVAARIEQRNASANPTCGACTDDGPVDVHGDLPAATGIGHNGGPPLDNGRRRGAADTLEPSRPKRANARQALTPTQSATPARGIASAGALKRGRGARSGDRAG